MSDKTPDTATKKHSWDTSCLEAMLARLLRLEEARCKAEARTNYRFSEYEWHMETSR